MRAITRERYGSPEVVELSHIDQPVPGDEDILIEVVAASVNRSDWEALTGKPLYARVGGLRRPKNGVLGTDVAGRVVGVGRDVTEFRPGDEVFGDLMYRGGGSFAEYVRVPESAPIVHKPEGLSFVEASALPQAALIALQGVEGVESGDRVLVNGAGGGSGVFAVQMAKTREAEVTAVDNGQKLEFMRLVGADEVIDYTSDDFTKTGTRYDHILDLFCERSMFAIRRALAPGGRYLLVGGTVPSVLSAATLGRLLSTGGRSMGVLGMRPNKEDMRRVAELVVSGELRVNIEKTYPLERAREALEHLGEGHALGKLVIEID